MIGLQAVLLMLCGMCQLVHSKTVEPDKSAVLFRNKGTVELSGRSYYVLLDISIENLVQAIEPIGRAINAVTVGLDTNFKHVILNTPRRTNKALINQNYTNSDPFTSLDHTLSANMQEHLSFLMSELNNKHESLINFWCQWVILI